MRERIEKGEHVDVFASADIGHARKLVEDGRATVMLMFARNTVCVLSPAAFGAATENVLEKLLAPGIKVGVSPANVDPLGDYTVRLFEMAERLRPGSGAALRARAVVLDTPPGSQPPKSGDNDAGAILDGRVDASIVYCSGRERYARILPDANLVALPTNLQVGPGCGLAVMKDAPQETMLLALTILSPAGQKILLDHKSSRSRSKRIARRVPLRSLNGIRIEYDLIGPCPATHKVNDNGIWCLDLLHRLLDLPGRIGGGARGPWL